MTHCLLKNIPMYNAEIVVFLIDSYPNHCGLYVPEMGLFDISFLGSRCVKTEDRKFPKGEMVRYGIHVPYLEKATTFLQIYATLPQEIITMEKQSRGWYLTRAAPDYVLNLRTIRSNSDTLINCVEWILRGLDKGGVNLPNDILTPNQLSMWCNQNLKQI